MDSSSFSVDFRCTSDPKASLESQILEFDLPPFTVGDITHKIEETLSIPESQTRVEISSATVEKSTRLKDLRLRNGDSVTVYYYSVADCKDVGECIEWMKRLLDILVNWKESGYCSTNQAVQDIRGQRCLSELSFTHFSPWMTPAKYANKIYFISKGGLVLVYQIMSILLDVRCFNLPVKLQQIESLTLGILWNITEDVYIFRAVVQTGGLEICTKALLRVPVTPFKLLPEDSYYEAARETIRKALGAFAK